MLSTVPAFSFAEPGLVNPFSDFQTGFTPWEWDCSDLSSVIRSSLKPFEPNPCFDESNAGSVRTNSGFENIETGSDESSAGSIKTNSGSDDTKAFHGVPSGQLDEPNLEGPKNSITVKDSGSEERHHNRTEMSGPVLQVVDERKRKRMESNRESAKRSRMRKQKHVENLRNQVDRLGLENRELVNRLRVVLDHIRRVSTDNHRLVAEQEILRRRLSEMRRVLVFRQLQQQWAPNNNNMILTEQNPLLIIDQMIQKSNT